ncbi:hypothetical protein QQY24_30425 [Streptomyces sp. TG1A-8]|uniref:hypothetical protein n=1 Tax=Streptomyces sp. TG1A-8 TaxID=3051385 RepID=UPI00265B8786|nr:hypothetical protein [Streptomyces sp. TG1A-8]MDO0929506.1 hypothetical protein [Streptomyces sp. TG1A-8]
MTKADMDEKQVRASLDEIVGQIRRYVPSMAPYFEIGASLGEYAAELHPAHVDPVHAARQGRFAAAVGRVLAQAFGPAAPANPVTAADVRAVNIVDHHQLLNHPLLLGTNIIANADRLTGAGPRRPVITLSCSNVAPGNHYMRGGFRYRGETVAYFAAKEHRDAMYYAPVRPFDFVERLRALKRWSRFGPDEQEFLTGYQATLNGLDHAHTHRHRDQLAVALRATWPLLFSPALRPRLPELLYATMEDVTRECLLDLLPEDNALSAALLDASFRGRVLDAFRGITVAWDEAAGKGTHFFWRRRPGRRQLLRMYVEGPDLVPADARFRDLRVPLERAALCDHLRREEIIPSVALCVSVLLHAGVKPLVGPGSLVYTTRLRDGWTDLLRRHGQPSEADLVAGIDTGGMIAGTPMFFARAGAKVRTLYAADVFSQGGVSEQYVKSVLNAPVKDLLSVGSSGVYDLFRHSYIPAERQLTERVGFDEAAAVVHTWL